MKKQITLLCVIITILHNYIYGENHKIKVYKPTGIHAPKWNDQKLNFIPIAFPFPAGDINGDGYNDFLINKTVLDDRKPERLEYIDKTLLFFGNKNSFSNKLFYRKLIPIGDINNDNTGEFISPLESGDCELLVYNNDNLITKKRLNISPLFSQIINKDINNDGIYDCIFSDKNGYIKAIFGAKNYDDLRIIDITKESASKNISIIEDNNKVYIMHSDREKIYTYYFEDNGNLVKTYIDNSDDLRYTSYQYVYEDFDNNGKKDLIAICDRGTFISKDYSPEVQSTNFVLITTSKLRYLCDIDGDSKSEFVQEYSEDKFRLVNIDFSLYSNIKSIDELHFYIDNPAEYNGIEEGNYYNTLPYDYNNDGNNEIIIVTDKEETINYNSIGINNNSIEYKNKVTFEKDMYSGIYPSRISDLGDTNGDNINELAAYSYGKTYIFNQDDLKNPIKILKVPDNNTMFYKISSGDLNNDGFNDFIIAYRDYWSFSKNKIEIYYGSSNRDFTPDKTIYIKDIFGTSNMSYNVLYGFDIIGSINGDSYPELAFSNSSYANYRKVYILKGDESISINNKSIIDLENSLDFSNNKYCTYKFIGMLIKPTGDINNDGIEDFLISDYKSDCMGNFNSGYVYIFFGKNDMQFTNPDLILYDKNEENETYDFGQLITTGDYNGDNVNDIAIIACAYKKEGIFIYFGGKHISSEPNQRLSISSISRKDKSLTTTKSVSMFDSYASTVPDLNNDNCDELIISEGYRKDKYSAIILKGSKSGLKSNPVAVIDYNNNLSHILKNFNSFTYSNFTFPVSFNENKGNPTLLSIYSNTDNPGSIICTHELTDLINKDPLDISLSSNSINELMPLNTVIGKLNTTDNNIYDTHIYSLTPDISDNNFDNSLFKIVNNKLVSNKIFNYKIKNTYRVNIETTDNSYSSIQKTFDIKIEQNRQENYIVNIYPNPAYGNVTISANGLITRIDIVDLQGRVLRSKSISDNTINLNINDIKPGTYILKTYFNKNADSQKLIINRAE